jgi:hypothetical protein
MNGKTVKFRKLMKSGYVKEARGYRRYVRQDGESIPVIIHKASRLDLWNVSDELTGCSITEANMSPEAALANASLRIAMVGTELYFTGRDKFQDIVLNGGRISGFTRKRVNPAKYKAYQAWAKTARAGGSEEKGEVR